MYLLILEDNELIHQNKLSEADLEANADGIADIIKADNGKFYRLQADANIDYQNPDSWTEIPFNPIEED